MSGPRTYLSDFALANPLYAGATVTVFTVDPVTLKRTTTLATIYDSPFGTSTQANPAKLDIEGKWQYQAYVDQPAIMLVQGATVADHETGIVGVIGSFRGEWATSTRYYTGDTISDGAAGSATYNIYLALASGLSSASFADDLAAGLWMLQVDVRSALGGMLHAPGPIGDVTPGSGAFTTISGKVTATGGLTSRPLADHVGDWINVKNFNAKLDGSTNDRTAFIAARTAAPANSVIRVPPGGYSVTGSITGGPSSQVLWQLSGNCFGSGSTPVTSIVGTDITETFFAGTKFFGRATSTDSVASSIVRIDNNLTHAGGTAGTKSGLVVNTNVTGNTASYGWGITAVTHSTSTGGGQHLALAAYAYKDADGDPVWGSNIYAYDTTGHASSVSGQIVAEEISVIASGGLDDSGAANALIPAGAGTRVGIDLIGQQGPNPVSTAEIGWVLRAGARPRGVQTAGPWSSSATYAKRIISTLGAFSIAAFDASLSTAMGAANAFRMASDQTFAFDGTDNTRTLSYASADTRLEYKVGGTTMWSVSDTGAMTAANLNLSNLPTSATGLTTGDLWIDTSASRTLKIAA